jgi:hypothetical protein
MSQENDNYGHARRFILLALKNRRYFLEPFRVKFEASEEPRVRAEIVIRLLKLEPSHIRENWIAAEVIEWMRNVDFKEYLEEAFLAQTDRERPTEKRRLGEMKDFFLKERIRRIKDEEGVPTDRAFRRLADMQMDNPNPLYPGCNSPDGGYYAIKKAFYSGRNPSKIDQLPYPYLGYDVREIDGRWKFVWRGAVSLGDGPRAVGLFKCDLHTFASYPPTRPR